jgi:hypothetical protein
MVGFLLGDGILIKNYNASHASQRWGYLL